MKKITGLLLLTACALVSNRASADLVAEWEFNSYSGGNATGVAAVSGSQAATAILTDFGGNNGVSVNPGTAANSADSVAGNAFGISSIGALNGPNYNSYSFQISGTGLSGFVLTYETQGTITTPQQWQWVATGQGGEHIFGSPVYASSSSSYGLQTIDFSGVTGLNNAATVIFYLDVGSPSDSPNSWSVDFDNFVISAVPEPVNTALACFGLGIAVVSLGRFYVSRRRRIS